MQATRIGRHGGVPRPIRRRNVSQEVVVRLAAEIAQGRLKPGERLRSERELSEAYAVSRSSVREAIKTLESRGLVEGRHGKGTFVCQPGLEALVQLPTAPLTVNEAEVLHLFEVREMLEPAMARLAAGRATPRDIAALRRLMQGQEQRVEHGRYTSDDDARFHLRVARITGNPVLTRLMEGVMHLLGVVREPALHQASTAGLKVSLAGHWQILRAIEAHDPEAAAARALHHLQAARETAIRVIREVGDRGDR